jgi:hypothetical protein
MPAMCIVVGGSAFSPVHDARMVRLPPGAAPAASAVALLITISPSLDRSRPRTIVQGGLGDSVPRDRALTPRNCAVSAAPLERSMRASATRSRIAARTEGNRTIASAVSVASRIRGPCSGRSPPVTRTSHP